MNKGERIPRGIRKSLEQREEKADWTWPGLGNSREQWRCRDSKRESTGESKGWEEQRRERSTRERIVQELGCRKEE